MMRSSLVVSLLLVVDAVTPRVKIGVDVRDVDVLLPLVGAGTWQYNDSTAYRSVCAAFEVGYEMVDTANGYGNQAGVGRAIRDCWKRPRRELFVMTKIPGGLNATEVAAAHSENLVLLGLSYVDHLMTHFPADWAASPARSSAAARQEEWRALEAIYASGEARSIGVSHYCSRHIEDVMTNATVVPSINQVEYHVGSGDVDDVIQACERHGIHFMSFSPLCGPCEESLLKNNLTMSIAAKHSITTAQVALRFIVQQALEKPFWAGVIPKSSNLEHLRSNLDLFSFALDADDMTDLLAAKTPAAEGGDCDVN